MNPRIGMMCAALIGAAGVIDLYPSRKYEDKPLQTHDDSNEKQRRAQEKRDRRAAKRINKQNPQ